MSNKTVNEVTKILMQAKDLIKNKNSWCQRQLSKINMANGEISYCAVGAVIKATRGNAALSSHILRYLIRVLPIRYYERIPRYNDENTHEDVMRLYDKAIELSMRENIS